MQGKVDGEMLDKMRELFGLTDPILVQMSRGMVINLLRTRGVSEAILGSMENYDLSKAEDDLAAAKAIAGKVLKGDLGMGLVQDVQSFLGLTDPILGRPMIANLEACKNTHAYSRAHIS